MSLSKFQQFEAVNIHRSSLKNAPYNPRFIDEKAKSKLRKALKKLGLVETLVWNKRTGNLVGGHKRLEILDDLEGTQDYEITVAMVNVDLKREKELNIVLNNPNLQGEYDFDVLKNIGDIDWQVTGFEPHEISYFKADAAITAVQDERTEGEEIAEMSLSDVANDKAERKAHVKAMKALQKQNVEETGEMFFVVTFRTITEKQEFLLKYGFRENEKYIDGYSLETIITKNENLKSQV